MTKKLTIGYVLDDTLDKSDGVQQAVLAIGEYMRSHGHEVHYIVPYTERTDIANVHSVARVVSLKFNGNSIRTPIWSSKKRIKQLYIDTKFDVLHVQMPYSPVMAARVVKAAPDSTRVVGTFHILPYNWFSKIGTRMLGKLLHKNKKRISQALAVSEPALTFMRKDFGLDGRVLGNPIDYSFFHQFKNSARQQAPKRIVFVGRFDERKGVKQLVEAYEKLNHDDPTIQLVMCGKGPLLQQLQSYAETKKLNIDFKGFVSEEEKARQLASADVAVFPSTGGESFGIVLTEAMAAGATITIGGNNAGYASVLKPWEETLFDPNDVDAFVTKLKECLALLPRFQQITREQHEYVKQFDIVRVADYLLTQVYN